MRLIDADRLLSDYSYLFMDIYGKECARMFVGIVNQAQTIDVGGELEKIGEEIQKYVTENKNSEDLYLAGCGDGAYHTLATINKRMAELKGEKE